MGQVGVKRGAAVRPPYRRHGWAAIVLVLVLGAMIPSSSVALDGDDPNDRARFVTAFHDKVMPFLERQPEFAGTWVDEAHDGRMLVMLTKARDAVVEGVGTRMPADSLGWQAVEVEYSPRP
jgi:hypothetical protein